MLLRRGGRGLPRRAWLLLQQQQQQQQPQQHAALLSLGPAADGGAPQQQRQQQQQAPSGQAGAAAWGCHSSADLEQAPLASASLWFQQIAALHPQHGYHAAALPQQHGGEELAHPPQRQRQHDHSRTVAAHAAGPPQAPQQALNCSSSSSSGGSSGAASGGTAQPLDAALPSAAAAEWQQPPDEDAPSFEFDALLLSSPEEQYRATLASLHLGHSRNLDQLARMFDPQAVLSAPDKGAGVLEAFMFAAAKLQDLQLLRQLLRCMVAAGAPLSATGHSAVLHCLAQCDRPTEALQWLQERVPPHLVSAGMLRALVPPLLRGHQLVAAEEALNWAAARLPQQQQQQQEASGAEDTQQVLACLRLQLAGSKATLAAVQQEWAAIVQAAEQQQRQHGSGTRQATQQALGVPVWASYVMALSRVARKGQWGADSQVPGMMQDAMQQLADEFHASAWQHYVRRAADQQLAQQQADAASRLWQHHQQQQQEQWNWHALNPARVVPQQVHAAAPLHARDLYRKALDAAMVVAAQRADAGWMQQLMQQASLLKVMPRAAGFDALFNLGTRQGDTPEALEELLSELMGWGITPSLEHYEHVMEAHALHRDLAAAEGCLDRLAAAGHSPLLRSYNRLLHGVAINGDLVAAMRIYGRLRLQGLQPDIQTMRCLFKCVRVYASNVRVLTARRVAQLSADRKTVSTELSRRTALLTSAYSQLATWQSDMAAAGLKHTGASMTHLTAALERLGAVDDCVRLAKLHEQVRPGDFIAHRAALKVTGRARDVRTAGRASSLAEQLSKSQALTKLDYLSIINSQFWVSRDHNQMLDTVAAMRAAGHELDVAVLLQLLHVYCHNGSWGEALQVLADLRSGAIQVSNVSADWQLQQAGRWPRSQHALARLREQSQEQQRHQQQHGASAGAAQLATNDRLWHVVMRKLWQARASDALLNEFLQHMAPAQVQRFKLLYGLQPLPGQPGQFTLQPLEDWQVQVQLESGLGDGGGASGEPAAEAAPPEDAEELASEGDSSHVVA